MSSVLLGRDVAKSPGGGAGAARRKRRVIELVLLLGVSALFGGVKCDRGEYDGGVILDAGGGGGYYTLEDIGEPCRYVEGSGQNPSTQCALGLSCLIQTLDGQYSPLPAGTGSQTLKPFWADSVTRYVAEGDENVSYGYCTVIAQVNPTLPPAQRLSVGCPTGTYPKFLNQDVVACVQLCGNDADCADGWVCDYRSIDVADQNGTFLSTCARPCEFDVPDCVRGGMLFTGADQAAVDFYLYGDDLFYSDAYCNVQDGICYGNPGTGTSPLGGSCTTTADCEFGTCLQWNIMGPTVAEGTPGICSYPCQPPVGPQDNAFNIQTPQGPQDRCPSVGFACQQAFTLGHFPFRTKFSTGQDADYGGWCFPHCMSAADCSQYPGYVCGQVDPNVVGNQPWQSLTVCLPPAMEGGN